jgi:CRISPR type III-A-associated RAMP protein Csm5
MEIELEIQSPLHIGSGEEITHEELLFENGTAYVPDINNYFRDHPDEIDAFVDGVEQGQPPGLFFENIQQYSRYAIELWATKNTVGRSPIKTVMKNAADEPYLPGSSLKGAIRTALAYHALNNEQELDDFTGNAVDRLFRPEQDDPKGDLLKCVTVRDSEPADPNDSLVLGEVKTYSLKENGEMRAKRWSNYAELLRPGTRFTTEISVDTGLLNRMVETNRGRRQAETVLGEGLTEQGIIERIAEALRAFERATVDEERTLTGDFDDIEAFYRRCEDGPPRLRLGFGTSYYSNTVANALPDTERISIQVDNRLGRGPFHENCGGTLRRDRRSGGRLFCPRCNTGDIDSPSDEVTFRFPKTRRVVLRDGSPEYPLGWVDVPTLSF